MALPASPPISLTQIQDEFGAPRGTGITAFVRGGAWVPNTPTNASVPTSPPISLLSLLGAAAYTPMVVTVPNVNGATISGGGANQLIGNATISTSFGIPPYTYLTTLVSGSSFTIGSPTTQFPEFRRPGNPLAVPASGVYNAAVTDSTATTVNKQFTVTDNRS